MDFELRGPRVRMRRWGARDRVPFAKLNADPEVMRYFPRPLTREESDRLAAKADSTFDTLGFGLWAVDVPAQGFIGFVGLTEQDVGTDFSPCIEVGWRLARESWGQGYATEAARLALDFGFRQCGFSRIVSMTATLNTPSRRVMERLGMVHQPGWSFLHPRVPADSPLSPHVVYSLERDGS